MIKSIPYGKHDITEQDIQAVISVLKSDYLTQGPKIEEFEKSFARYIGCKYAVAVTSGTAALHLAILALGLNSGERVITTPVTFVASANCVLYARGQVSFADIDPDTYLIDINAIKKLLEDSPTGTYKGIIPVDLAGRAVNLERLRELADEYNLWIIEDASHSPGGYFLDSNNEIQNCGNGKFADLSVFSFHPVKHIACGEGGMITTNNEELYNRLRLLRTHGITKEHDLLNENHGGWYYEMQELGYNYRMTDIQAALGYSQLQNAKDKLQRRKEIAKVFADSFVNNPKIIGQSGWNEGHAYHLYIIEVERRKELYEFLKLNGIFAQVHYIPIHLQPYYRQFGWKYGDFPNSEKYYSSCLSLPMYPTLSDEEQLYVISKIEEFLK